MARKNKLNAKQVAANLKDCDRWLVTVSRLDTKTEKIETVVTSNHFLTNDFPAIRKQLSEQLYNMWAKKEALEDGMTQNANIVELKVQGMIE